MKEAGNLMMSAKELGRLEILRQLPLVDGWGHSIWIWTDGISYRIVSAGRNGILQHDWVTTEGAGATASFDSDIVLGDGRFQQWPEGDWSWGDVLDPPRLMLAMGRPFVETRRRRPWRRKGSGMVTKAVLNQPSDVFEAPRVEE